MYVLSLIYFYFLKAVLGSRKHWRDYHAPSPASHLAKHLAFHHQHPLPEWDLPYNWWTYADTSLSPQACVRCCSETLSASPGPLAPRSRQPRTISLSARFSFVSPTVYSMSHLIMVAFRADRIYSFPRFLMFDTIVIIPLYIRKSECYRKKMLYAFSRDRLWILITKTYLNRKKTPSKW